MESIEILNGLLTTTFVFITFFVGIKIALKYRDSKDKLYLWMGISWILMVQPYWPAVFSFLLNLFTFSLVTNSILPDLRIYLMFEIFVPFSLTFGVLSITEFILVDYRKQVIIFFNIWAVIFQILLLYMLVVDPTMIGVLNGYIDIEYSFFTKMLVLFMLGAIYLLGILFARESFKSPDPNIKRKGKLLLVAFILYPTGVLMDTQIPNNSFDLFQLLTSRIILIASSITFLLGFLLPKFLRVKDVPSGERAEIDG